MQIPMQKFLSKCRFSLQNFSYNMNATLLQRSDSQYMMLPHLTCDWPTLCVLAHAEKYPPSNLWVLVCYVFLTEVSRSSAIALRRGKTVHRLLPAYRVAKWLKKAEEKTTGSWVSLLLRQRGLLPRLLKEAELSFRKMANLSSREATILKHPAVSLFPYVPSQVRGEWQALHSSPLWRDAIKLMPPRGHRGRGWSNARYFRVGDSKISPDLPSEWAD